MSAAARVGLAAVAYQSCGLEAACTTGHGHRDSQVQGRKLERRKGDGCSRVRAAGLVANGGSLGGRDPGRLRGRTCAAAADYPASGSPLGA